MTIKRLPVLFLDDVVLLPGMVVPIELGESARAAVDAATAAGTDLLVAPRLDGATFGVEGDRGWAVGCGVDARVGARVRRGRARAKNRNNDEAAQKAMRLCHDSSPPSRWL